MTKIVVHTEPVVLKNIKHGRPVGEPRTRYIATVAGSIIAENLELMSREQAYDIWGRGNVIFKK